MNRSVLIVTPFFAPQTHAAVFRAYKLAKYLPRYGWKPYVLTVDKNYNYNEDPTLLEALPPEVEIHRARYIEPTLRGLRMAFGGEDRSFAALKRRLQQNCALSPWHSGPPSPAQRLYNWVLRKYVAVPDQYWTWVRPAVRVGKALIERHRIPIVYTTCLPYSCNRIGLTLQRKGAVWVADFRDPAGYAAKVTSPEERAAKKQRRIVRETLKEADAVTVLAPSYALVFGDMFPELRGRKAHFIPTGVDEELLPTGEPGPLRPWPYLLFAGEYLPEYDPSFFVAFADAIKTPALQRSQIRLLVVGHELLNRMRLGPLLQRLGIERLVEFMDQQPQPELYRLIRAARACLLIPGETVHWWASYAKLADYIALQKPVIAVVPDPSVARSALVATRLGVFLDGDHDSRVTTLIDFLVGRMALPPPNEAECERYMARRQVESFVELFEELRESRARSTLYWRAGDFRLRAEVP